MLMIDAVVGSYRQAFTTGATTTLAAGAPIFSMRWVHASIQLLLVKLDVEFFLTTAFGAAQEVGFDAFIARAYTVSPTNGTAVVPGANDAKMRTGYPATVFAAAGDIRTASAAAITAGTRTLDNRPVAKGSYDASAIRTRLGPLSFDFSQNELGGELLANNEGIEIQNSVLMGATGVGTWKFTPTWKEVLVYSV